MITIVRPKASRPRIADCCRTLARLPNDRKLGAANANARMIRPNAPYAPARRIGVSDILSRGGVTRLFRIPAGRQETQQSILVGLRALHVGDNLAAVKD